MTVKFTSDAEVERVNNSRKVSWELYQTYSLPEVVHKAVEMGWAEKKVQVRAEHINGEEYLYTIEPFERDCSCPSILRYSEYAPERETIEY